jgi:N-acetylneuraminic acid mutarotase
MAITEEGCPSPSRRAVGSFTANPINLDELIMFGGEYYDGQKVTLFNDLHVYRTDKNEWRKYSSPNSPQPRSSHQFVLTPSGRGFLFGGEFVSPNQTTFFHYKDFWSIDLKTFTWEKLEVGKKPSPRSGHRMVIWKHFIILYGGFYDAGKETKYLDDLWIFNIEESKWTEISCIEPKRLYFFIFHG